MVAIAVTWVTAGAAANWAIGWGMGTAATATTAATLTLAGSITTGAIAGAAGGFVGGALMTGSVEGAFRGALTGAIAGAAAGYANFGRLGGFWDGTGRIGVAELGGCASGKVSGGSCSEGAKLAAIAQSVSMGMEMFSKHKPTWKTAEGEAVVKPSDTLKKTMGSKCEICDVVDDGVPNTGTAVTTDNINLVGKPVSWALENFPNEIEVPFIGGESGFLGFVSRNSPGFNSASVFHDKGVGFLERALGFEGTLFGTASMGSELLKNQ